MSSASRERDRGARARWRLVLGLAVVGGLVLAFGGTALRTQRKELGLERALALAELRQVRDEQLARENRAATMLTLAAGVAHEVSTPLSVIAGRAEQLAGRAADDERARRAAQVIAEQTERIRDVVQGFLRLARGGAPVLEAVEPPRVVRAAVALVGHRFAKAGVVLEARLPPSVPAVRGDGQLLEQAIVNLLLNACDACVRGGRVSVEVEVEADAEAVTFAVLDDGAGISAAAAARVGQPFFSTKPEGHGSGLGLAITAEIVKLHRGALVLEPRRDRGTRAVIRVPTEGGSLA